MHIAQEAWDQQEPRVKMAGAIAEAMSRSLRLGSDRDLLDFGTGTGLIALRLQPHVRKVFAFDTSVGMLRALGDKLSQNRITNVELAQGMPSRFVGLAASRAKVQLLCPTTQSCKRKCSTYMVGKVGQPVDGLILDSR
jgi:SAM-dependent methyltransferase